MPGIKPWSLSTTVRNPHRLRGFLSALAELEGEVWNRANQERFQIILIQRHLYGAQNSQFLAGLSPADVALINGAEEIPYAEARRIFFSKGYEDPPMRGRTSFKPLEKLLFAYINPDDRLVRITPVGRELLNPETDFGEMVLRSLVKWQLPNPLETRSFPARLGYRIKPFVGTLHLIRRVNDLCEGQGLNATGLSFDEFNAFVPTLIDWEKISEVAEKIVAIRIACRSIPRSEREVLRNRLTEEYLADFDLRHIRDYGDNTRRYFRLTRYIRFRGDGRFVDLEPRRSIEINALLATDDGSPQVFNNLQDYVESVSPILILQTNPNLVLIYRAIIDDIAQLDAAQARQLEREYPVTAEEAVLSAAIASLRVIYRDLQRREDTLVWQTAEKTQECAQTLAGLSQRGACTPEDLEYHIATALMSLDAAREVIPNYPVGEDNRPIYTAPGGVPDIECFYEGFNLACEVTLMRDSKQWISEGQPVLRHVQNFRHNHDGVTYGLFIAPVLHRDTVNHFWFGVKGVFEGEEVTVFPLTIDKFARVLETCANFRANGGVVRIAEVAGLFNGLAAATVDCPDSRQWPGLLDAAVDAWCGSLRPAGGLL